MQAVKKIEYLASDWPEKKREEGVQTPWLIHPIRFGFQTIGRLFPKAAGKLTYTLFTTPRKRARHRVSDPTLEKARIFEFLYAKQVLKGYSWGKGEKTILLVHGWESRGTAMRSFVAPFLAAGYRVVAFDGPAHGNSEGRRTNLPEFAKAIRAFIHHVGPVEAAICHSFGGVAMMYALSQLEIDTRVRRVVTISSPNDVSLMLKQATDFMRVPKPAQKHFRTIIEYKMLMPVAKASLGKWGNSIMTEDILIVHDEEDRVVPVSEALAIFESLDQANVLISKGYGHYQLTKNPDVIRRITQFILST
ncbi:MAG: alpha/beta hydrolase [Saprospiraceae bacterium]|nr:alpha/beta hydrolase [Saprospiraceae bacterium]